MKSGYVAVVGRANAGKSTLINVLVGEKVSIVSPKPQTTRNRILGILTKEDCQIVFVDTPGLYKAEKKLSSLMQNVTLDTVEDVDVVLYLIDIHEGAKESDIELLKKTVKDRKVILALTKIDIMPKERLMEEVAKFGDIDNVTDIVPISSRTGKNLDTLMRVLLTRLPEGEAIYGDVVSDKSEKFMVGEIMREKILLLYDKEIPHGVAVVVNELSKRDNGNYYVNLDIICEKANHKAILIGKQGASLKRAASFAREEMEKFLDAKVYLTTYVVVKEDWRDKTNYIRDFGYDDKE